MQHKLYLFIIILYWAEACVHLFNFTEERKSDIVYVMRAIPSCLSPDLFAKIWCRLRMTEKSIFYKVLMDLLISHPYLITHVPLLTYSPNQSIPLHGCQWKRLQAERWWQVPARHGYIRYRTITPELKQTSWHCQTHHILYEACLYVSITENERKTTRERQRVRWNIWGMLIFQADRQKMFSKSHSISRQNFGN